MAGEAPEAGPEAEPANGPSGMTAAVGIAADITRAAPRPASAAPRQARVAFSAFVATACSFVHLLKAAAT